jgi:long-chain fatty acid transport protein
MLISFSRFSFVINRPLMMVPLMVPLCALANNGLNLSGYGAESEALGGADAAVARDTFATNTNPAGLTQTQGQLIDIYAAPWFSENTHTDQNGNYRKKGNAPFGIWGAGGYAKHVDNTPFTIGVGVFLQGGAGFAYKHLDTPFSTRDEITSTFAVFKLAPAIAWKINDQWSVGSAIALNYASAAQTFFPNTSDATSGFAGLNFKDASGFGLSGRVGFQYRPTEALTIGMFYGTSTKIPLKGGSLRVNYPGIGVVRYDDAQLKGFRLPQEIAVGFAYRPIKPLLISVQDKWLDWSASVKDFTLVAKSPRSSNPGVQPVFTVNSPIRMRDQHVYSFGVAYDYSEETTLLGGVNYAKRAVPDENIGPALALIQQPHYMLGLNRKIDKEWNVLSALEFVIPRQMVTLSLIHI